MTVARSLVLTIAVATVLMPLEAAYGFASLSSTSLQSSETTRTAELSSDDVSPRVCVYRNASTGNRWMPRTELSNLQLGQELLAVVVQEKLRDAATGPKVWVEAGVGRCRDGRHWKIVNGMLRLGHRNTKDSVARKKAAKLRGRKEGFPVFVSRIRLEQDQFEVVLQPEQVGDEREETMLQSSSKLRPGEEVKGTVVRVEPYGCIVDLDGYNRKGLLHIQRVADLYGRYIDKAAGLEDAGLERKTRVKLQVLSNEKKRLFLDFTDDVKQEAAKEQQEMLAEKEKQQQRQQTEEDTVSTGTAASTEMSAEEIAEWEAYYKNGENDNDDDAEDSYDDYDEERDIEDALGLGTY